MLKIMRDSFQQLKWILVAIVAVFILFIFVDWGAGGPGGASAKDRGYAARVNGDTISNREYERALNYTEKNYEQLYRQSLTSDMIQQMGLPKQVIDTLIDEHLMLQQAAKLHLTATPDEIRARILEIPILNQGGKFVGDELYTRYVTGSLGFASASEFEDELAREITLKKMESAMANSVVIAPKAADAEYRRVSENGKIHYALYPATREAALVTVTPQEVEQYYRANQTKYMHGEQRAVKYLIADYTRLRAQIQPTDSDLKKRYDASKEDFKHPAQAHVLHILLKLDQNASPADDAKAKTKADDLVKQLRAGADFAKLARENSGDPGSAANGGDLGWINPGQTVPPFDHAAFSDPIGQISDPVKSQFGYHIIKVLERRAEGYKTFEEAKPQLLQQYVDQASKDQARDAIATIAQRIKKNPPKSAAEFTALANDKVTSNDTQWFGKTDMIPGVGYNQALTQWAFAAKLNDTGDIIGTSRGPAIPFVYGVRPAGLTALDEIRPKVENDARLAKARDAAKAVVAKAMVGATSVDDVAKKLGITATDTNITRQGNIPGFTGDATPLVDATFSSNVGQMKGPIEVADGAVILQVTDIKRVTQKEIDDNRQAYMDQMRQQEARNLKQSLLNRMRKTAKIDVNPTLLQPANSDQGQQSGL